MQGRRILFKIGAVSALATLAIFFGYYLANAQSTNQPQFLVTWSASNSYVPTGYPDQILPNQLSQITASFELIANGQPIDLSNQIIYWYLDDTLLGGGVGVQHFTFRPYGQAPTTESLKIEMPNYPSGELIHQITIPLTTPVVVPEAPYPNGQFSQIPLVLTAIPYFFNASSAAPLSFAWTVNDQTVTSAENPQSLKISLPQSTPAGFAVTINLTAKNSLDGTMANNTANLTYAPLP